MSEIDKCVKDLKKAILESTEYKDYIAAYESLAQYPSLLRETNGFRKENFYIQHSIETSNAFDTTQNVRSKYENLRSQELVENFLQAELCFARMMQHITKEVTADIKFDIDFLDD